MTRTRSTHLALLVSATAVGSLGLAAGGTAGALVATEISGQPSTAGLPLGALVAGSGAGALLLSRWARRAGRGPALAAGYGIGVLGALLVLVGVGTSSLAVVLTGSVALGVANAAVFLTRYAAADLGTDGRRGRALGLVLAGAATGAVAGPNLLGPSGAVAHALGLPRTAGLYLVAVAAFATAGAMLGQTRRGAPGEVTVRTTGDPVAHSVAAVFASARARIALVVLAATNLAMVATMAVAPVHLAANGHELSFVGLAVGVHVLFMFAPGPLWGWLTDVAGSVAVIAAGATLLAVAGVAGVVVDAAHGTAATVALAVLGLGWGAGVVGGSAMLADAVPAAQRPRTEAVGEVAMSVAAGAGAPLAGVAVAFGEFAALGVGTVAAGAVVAAVLRFGVSDASLQHADR